MVLAPQKRRDRFSNNFEQLLARIPPLTNRCRLTDREEDMAQLEVELERVAPRAERALVVAAQPVVERRDVDALI